MNNSPHRSIAVILIGAAAIGHLLIRAPQVAHAASDDGRALTCNAISGYVYDDVNFNGLRDAEEPPLADVNVELFNSEEKVIASTQTDATGFYSFTVDTSIVQASRQISYVLPIAQRTTDFTQTVNLPKFDPAWGDLLSVHITPTGQLTTLVRAENTDTSAQLLVATVAARFTTQGPAIGSVVAQSPLEFIGSFNASAFDGLIDFKGTSGIVFAPKMISATASALLTDSASLSLYTGPGTLTMSMSTIGSSSSVGSSNVNLLLSTSASGQLLVNYGYVPSRCIKEGTYTVREQQPPNYDDGFDTGGNVTPIPNSNGGRDSIPVQVTTGEDRPNNNFGEWRPASLSGFVYHDADDDGLFDMTESPIHGTVIQLTGQTVTGTLVVITQSTTVTGGYNFSGLWPGIYTLTEMQPPNWDDGQDTQGTPGNGTSTNDQFAHINLQSGVEGKDNNFGEHLPIPVLTLVKTVGTLPSVCATTTIITVPMNTPVYYCYTVTNTGKVALITHTLQDDKLGILLNDVVINLAPGASTFITAPATIAITTTNVATWTARPPLGPPATGIATATVHVPPVVANASLGDYVWMDTDNDGLQDNDEPGASKTKITLYANGVPVSTTVTTWQGYYSFTHLTAGVPYTLHFDYDMKNGMTWTMRYAGNILKDSNVDKHGNTEPVILAPGEFNRSIDAGIDLGLVIGQVAVDGALDNGQCPDRLITYTLIVDNNGIFTLSDVMLYNLVPTNTQYVENSASVPPTMSDNILIWQLPTMKPTDRFVVSFAVQVTVEETATVVNTAYIGNTDFPILATTVDERRLVCNDKPTAISLAKFEALPAQRGVRVNWTTALEQDSYGFAIYRSETNQRGQAVRLNTEWIASAGRAAGATYTWLDESAQLGVSYHYWLQEMELSGALREYGPVQLSVEPLPSSPIAALSANAGGVAMSPAQMPNTSVVQSPEVGLTGASATTEAPATAPAAVQIVQATLVPAKPLLPTPALPVGTPKPTSMPSPSSSLSAAEVASVEDVSQASYRADAPTQPIQVGVATAEPTQLPIVLIVQETQQAERTVAVLIGHRAQSSVVAQSPSQLHTQPTPNVLSGVALLPMAVLASLGAVVLVAGLWLLLAAALRAASHAASRRR